MLSDCSMFGDIFRKFGCNTKASLTLQWLCWTNCVFNSTDGIDLKQWSIEYMEFCRNVHLLFSKWRTREKIPTPWIPKQCSNQWFGFSNGFAKENLISLVPDLCKMFLFLVSEVWWSRSEMFSPVQKIIFFKYSLSSIQTWNAHTSSQLSQQTIIW